ncbi:MAG: type III secretion system export apparatus subunit SctR [Alphaproteobacteria bacterium]|nr:type III secretion system export apparatus subunit SctR [Alphaproteobacteria bacterium]
MGSLSGFSQNQLALILFLGVLPFIMISLTSFVKIAVVISLLRNALGIQQIPPNIVIYSVALIMTGYVMYPVGLEAGKVILEAIEKGRPVLGEVQRVAQPFVQFTERFASPNEVSFFRESAVKMWGQDLAESSLNEDAKPISKLIVLMPAFVISELTRAFQIGFLLYLPFIVIDLIVANVLLALGMSSLSPVTVSLPLKLLLFIGLDGWRRLLEALVLSYTGNV